MNCDILGTCGNQYCTGTVRYFLHDHYFVFIVNEKKRTSSTMPFRYGKLHMKIKKKKIPPRRKRA